MNINMDEQIDTRCGYVAIVGRPNVGKSTLLNYILGQKLSITSKKPQTTRHQLLGIKTSEKEQVLYVDTPGIHGKENKAINRYMNKSAKSIVKDVDVVIFVTDRTDWQDDDEITAESLRNAPGQIIIAINKIDLLKDKERLLPKLKELSDRFPDAVVIPISAEKGDNLEQLELLVSERLPYGQFLFSDDQLTDRSMRFLVSEIIREKIMRQLGAEVPYQVTVEIEEFRAEKKVTHISALILVERDGQKKIIIGTNGDRIKKIGEQARADIESLLDCKVMLRTWVKVRSGWSDDERALRSLGYMDD